MAGSAGVTGFITIGSGVTGVVGMTWVGVGVGVTGGGVGAGAAGCGRLMTIGASLALFIRWLAVIPGTSTRRVD